jgi:hypothetical protein
MSRHKYLGSRSAAGLLLAATGFFGLAQCGGGSVKRSSSATDDAALDVRVSAGGPVSGATVTVYAIADGNGQVNGLVGNLGVLGAGGPTDAAGKATVKLAVKSYTGPIQVVASGANLTYPDPTVVLVQGKPATLVQIPSTFVLSSYLAQYRSGTTAVVPVTLVGTLADHAALAFARGQHPLHPGPKTLGEALAARDPLWVTHFTASANAWNPATLRSTVPSMLTDSSTTLVDSGYAGLGDVALNQLARDTATKAGYGVGSSAMTAITLTQLLEEDLDADAVLNGKGSAGAAIVTQGTSPVTLDSQFLRKPLAQALDTWIQNVGLNLSGIHQADLIAAQVFSVMSSDASDLFGDPPAGSYDPVDRAPPAVALVAEPATYTGSSKITLSITASDPSSVANVFVRVGGTRYPAAHQTDGTWQVAIQLPAVGHNIIAIWAADQSPSANSGLDGQPPYQLTRDILFDTTPPAPQYDTNFASYYDERGVAVSPQVPLTYTTGPKTAVAQGGHFYKVATRLSAGPQASAAEMETTNAQNIPLLRFAVPYNSQTDSAITEATYALSMTCPSPCPAFPDATGALLVSPTRTDQAVYFTLPLATEYVPALANVQGAATLSVTITVADAAGNRNANPFPSFTFHVLGPPLVVAEDTSYPAANDGKSAFPYRANQANYAILYDSAASVFNPENMVRLLHYTITNPAAQPVALLPSVASGAWYDNETWTGTATAIGYAYYASPPGWVSPNPAWGLPMGACQYIQNNTSGPLPTDLTTASVQFSPCAGGTTAVFTPAGGSPQCNSDPGAASTSGPQTSAGLSMLAYYGDGSAARTTATGHYIVPAASGSSPGALSLYVVRPRASLQARIPLTGWNGGQYVQDIGQEATLAVTYHHPSYLTYGPCEYWNGSWVSTPVYRDNLTHYSRTLASASDSVSGTLQLQSFGVNPGSSEIGEVQTIPGGIIDLTRAIPH